jgi:hypothetical protein
LLEGFFHDWRGIRGMRYWWQVTCEICGVVGYRKRWLGARLRVARHVLKHGKFHRCEWERIEREAP